MAFKVRRQLNNVTNHLLQPAYKNLCKCRVEYRVGEESVSRELYSILEGMKTGVIEDKKGWITEIQ